MKRIVAGILLFSHVVLVGNLFSVSVDDYYKFPEQSLPGNIQFEKTRKLCLFPLKGDESPSLNYLSDGIPSVLLTPLQQMELIYDDSPLPVTIQNKIGNPTEKRKPKEFDETTLEKLNSGKLKLLPEVDPRYIRLQVVLEKQTLAPNPLDSFTLAKKFDCFYVITGEYAKKDVDSLETKLTFFQFKDGTFQEFTHKTSFRRAFQEMQPLANQIKSVLITNPLGRLTVKTNEENAFVYLDGIFLGKTPIIEKDIYSGIHEVFITKEGFIPYSTQIELSGKELVTMTPTLLKREKTAFLTVTSDPEGAEVYHGVTFLGNTPLTKVPINVGMNRVRVSLDGFVDHFTGIEAEKGKEVKVDAKLKLGDSVKYYKYKNNIFLDYTYKDFALFSFYSTLVFYAGYAYFNIKAEEKSEQLRNQRQLLTITNLTPFFGGNASQSLITQYFIEQYYIDQNQAERNELKRIAGDFGYRDPRNNFQPGYMMGGMFLSLASAFTFYFLSLDRESLDVGYRPRITPGFPIEGEAFGRYTIKF